jgi:hypothetical protein
MDSSCDRSSSSGHDNDLWRHWSKFCYECIGEDVFHEACETEVWEPISEEEKAYLLERWPKDQLELYYEHIENRSKSWEDYEPMSIEDFKEYPMVPSHGLQECHICG